MKRIIITGLMAVTLLIGCDKSTPKQVITTTTKPTPDSESLSNFIKLENASFEAGWLAGREYEMLGKPNVPECALLPNNTGINLHKCGNAMDALARDYIAKDKN